MTRISSLDTEYVIGALSLFPTDLDDKTILYEATNNAESELQQNISYTSKYIVVKDASKFPPCGIIRVYNKNGIPSESELIYYGKRTNSVFSDLIRGFAKSRQNIWDIQGTFVAASVVSEHHNAIKDAILNIQTNLGTKFFPSPTSLNGILTDLEVKHLTPKALFRAYPLEGAPPQPIRFQNFSGSNSVRFLWDFGDGSSSVERSPTHTYQEEGIYTVKLNVINSSGSQGIYTKKDYITISNEKKPPFYYVVPSNPLEPNYSVATSHKLNIAHPFSTTPQIMNFVDQTDGPILQRFWVFGDGETTAELNPNIHSTTHVYQKPGTYSPSLLIVFESQKISRVFLSNTITII